LPPQPRFAPYDRFPEDISALDIETKLVNVNPRKPSERIMILSNVIFIKPLLRVGFIKIHHYNCNNNFDFGYIYKFFPEVLRIFMVSLIKHCQK
jgi:hypothetical protein